jgi:hypothetical protein
MRLMSDVQLANSQHFYWGVVILETSGWQHVLGSLRAREQSRSSQGWWSQEVSAHARTEFAGLPCLYFELHLRFFSTVVDFISFKLTVFCKTLYALFYKLHILWSTMLLLTSRIFPLLDLEMINQTHFFLWWGLPIFPTSHKSFTDVAHSYTSYLFYPSQHNNTTTSCSHQLCIMSLLILMVFCYMFQLMNSHHQAYIHYQLILKLLNCYLHAYMLEYYNYY